MLKAVSRLVEHFEPVAAAVKSLAGMRRGVGDRARDDAMAAVAFALPCGLGDVLQDTLAHELAERDRCLNLRARHRASADKRVDHRRCAHRVFDLLGQRQRRGIGKIEDGQDRIAREGDTASAVRADDDGLRQIIFVHERIARGDPFPTSRLRELLLAVDRHRELHVARHVEPAVDRVHFGRRRRTDTVGALKR
jgi:hypothetical protein